MLSRSSNRLFYRKLDNRVKVYDTDSNKEKTTLVDKDYQNNTYLCQTHNLKVDKKNGESNGSELFAVGCENGQIIVWDVKRGIITCNLNMKNPSALKVYDLTISKDQKQLWTCSNTEMIAEYDLENKKWVRGISLAGKMTDAVKIW